MDIKPIPEHNPKYNISKEELEKANQTILNMSQKRKEEEGKKTVIKNGAIIHKRTPYLYKSIWRAFKKHDEDFRAISGYGIIEIEKIGINKFIDAMDWRNAKDVEKFKTDKCHVMICVNCNNDFGIFEITYSLCPSCVKLFDIKKLNEHCSIAQKEHERGAFEVSINFLMHKDYRDNYLLEELKNDS